MTKTKIEPVSVVVNFLRANLTDPNSSRSGQWIYADFPRVKDLGNASFPRVGVTTLTESGRSMGLFDDNSEDTINLQIDVISKKKQFYSVTVTDEALGTLASDSNSDRFTFDFVPDTITNIKHDGSAYGTTSIVATDSDFTTPASLSAGTVQVSFSTGNVNFSAADIASHDGEAITSTYVYGLEGKQCSDKIAREIVKKFKNNWRTDSAFAGLFYPVKISSNPLPFDDDLGIFRRTMQYEVRGFNAGEGQ